MHVLIYTQELATFGESKAVQFSQLLQEVSCEFSTFAFACQNSTRPPVPPVQQTYVHIEDCPVVKLSGRAMVAQTGNSEFNFGHWWLFPSSIYLQTLIYSCTVLRTHV